MNQIAENIKQRLSLRKPLQEALDILVSLETTLFPGDKKLSEIKNRSIEELKTLCDEIQQIFPNSFSDFEREFPSIC